MGQVARVLGLNVSRVSDVVGGLASGGTVDEASQTGQATRLRVQPEILRYALVRDVFFGGAGSLEVADAIAELDRRSNALLPLVGAARLGAPVSRAALSSLVDPNDSDGVTSYALLGPDETREALQIAPEHRASIARAAYESGISPEPNLRLLMELAVGDLREEHNSPDHPLRVIGDHLAGPDGTIEARRLAVSVADRWLCDGGDSAVAFRVLKHALEPRTRLISVDSGLGNTVTISEGAVRISTVRELSQLWDSVLEIVARKTSGACAPLIEALHPWVYPETLGFGRGPDEATAAAIRDEATRVISRLAVILRDRPGVLHRLQDYVTSARLAVTVEVPEEFDVLFPADWDGAEDNGGYNGWAGRANAAVHRLAAHLQELPVGEVAARMTEADAEAAEAGITYPRLIPGLAQFLAAETENPEPYLAALEELNAAGDVLLPFLDRVVELRPDGWEASVERLLGDARMAWPATQVVLTRPVCARLKNLAIQRMTSAYSNLVKIIIARGEADAHTLERLLNAPDTLVARDVAVALGHSGGSKLLRDLPESAQARWREVIVQSPADDYWYSEILKGDGILFAEWLRGWFERIRNDVSYEHLPHTLEEAIGHLPVELRAQLIRAVPSDVHSFYVQDVVTQLVSSDVEVAEALFERADLKDIHWIAVRDGPSEAWMGRALMALERGWEPARIVASTMFAERVWAGEESLHWQGKIDAFENLRRGAQPADARREQIIIAGIEYFDRERGAAAERERRERVFGR
jgi:hypothetical protein